MLPTEETEVPPHYRYKQIADDLAEASRTTSSRPAPSPPAARADRALRVTEPLIGHAPCWAPRG